MNPTITNKTLNTILFKVEYREPGQSKVYQTKITTHNEDQERWLEEYIDKLKKEGYTLRVTSIEGAVDAGA